MKKLGLMIASLVIVLLYGCPGTIQGPLKASEALIQTSHPQRPLWTLAVPETEGGKFYFVGYSDRYKAKASARESAHRAVIEDVVKYMKTLMDYKFKKIEFSRRHEGYAIAPTAEDRELLKQLSVNVAKRVKNEDYYFERYKNPTGVYYQYFALGYLMESEIDKAYKDTFNNLIRDAEKAAQKAKEKNDIFAKREAEDKVKFFKDMQGQDLTGN